MVGLGEAGSTLPEALREAWRVKMLARVFSSLNPMWSFLPTRLGCQSKHGIEEESSSKTREVKVIAGKSQKTPRKVTMQLRNLKIKQEEKPGVSGTRRKCTTWVLGTRCSGISQNAVAGLPCTRGCVRLKFSWAEIRFRIFCWKVSFGNGFFCLLSFLLSFYTDWV